MQILVHMCGWYEGICIRTDIQVWDDNDDDNEIEINDDNDDDIRGYVARDDISVLAFSLLLLLGFV